MRIDIATLFPEMIELVLGQSIIGNARKEGKVEVYTHNIRDYADNKHNRVDGYPYGGGVGMLLRPEPVYRCIMAIKELHKQGEALVIYMSPKGARLDQKKVLELKDLPGMIILAGHYEGIDQRVLDLTVDREISVGDYVLTGGELPAMVLADAVIRCLPGVLSCEECYIDESHASGRLEYAQYTRPEVWQGFRVPDVLISGNHEEIEKWQEGSSLKITKQNRPDLLE